MIGIDIVDVERLRDALIRRPNLALKLFTQVELDHANARRDTSLHLAGTLAAKEAVIKALGLSSLVKWTKRIEVARGDDGKPSALIDDASGTRRMAISISHDAGIATAIAMETTAADENIRAPIKTLDRLPALVFTSQMEACAAEG